MAEKKNSKGLLEDVAENEAFLLANGAKLKNLKELLETLKQISEQTFRHHVTENRNDFANWLRHSVGDVELADTIEKIAAKDETIRAIENRIAELEDSGLQSNNERAISKDSGNAEFDGNSFLEGLQNEATPEKDNMPNSNDNGNYEPKNNSGAKKALGSENSIMRKLRSLNFLNSLKPGKNSGDSATELSKGSTSIKQDSWISKEEKRDAKEGSTSSNISLDFRVSGSEGNADGISSIGGINGLHPFEHLKHSLMITIRDILIGVIIGLVVGYFLGYSVS